MPGDTYAAGLALVLLVVLAALLPSRFLPAGMMRSRHIAFAGMLAGAVLGLATYALLGRYVASAHLFFVPFIVVTGLLANLRFALLAALASGVAYLTLAHVLERNVPITGGLLNIGVFMLSASVAGLLAEELRSHHARERREQRRAAAVGHRLAAVVDAVEEAIVFSDRDGMVQMMNPRAVELFDLDADAHLGDPEADLMREIALQLDDPEDYIERLQEVRGHPDQESRWRVEQIMPARRMLDVLSRPALDDKGKRVGRVEVFVDVSEEVRRAAEVERLYREARTTAESYQRALLPPAIPALPRVSLVAHYIPAAGRRAVCGDFYDFLTLSDGRVAVLLGDPCGIGPAAVSDGALARYTVGSILRTEVDPGRLLQRAQAVIRDRLSSDRFVRLLVAVLDPERAILEYASAGHVPPMLFRARDGEVEILTAEGLPIGVEDKATFEVGRRELQPGDMLFLYTDGVNEAARNGRPLGQGKLKDLVGDYGVGTPGELVQAVRRAVEAWVDGTLRDDMAMVGCQVVPDADVGEPVRELVLPNDPTRTREVRSFVADFLADLRAPMDATADILLAAGEAAGNAVKYGRRLEGRSEIRVRCRLDDLDVVITVADDGPGFVVEEVETHELPDPLSSGGRGLFLMRELMDDIDIDSSPSGTIVTMSRAVFEESPLRPA